MVAALSELAAASPLAKAGGREPSDHYIHILGVRGTLIAFSLGEIEFSLFEGLVLKFAVGLDIMQNMY